MKTSDKNTKKILSGTTWLAISALFLKILGLIYKIPMSYILGDEGMGYFNSAYTIYTLFFIVGSAGIGKAVSIVCAKSSSSESKSVFLITFRLYFFIGLLLTLVLAFLSKIFSVIIGSAGSFYTILCIAPSVFFVCLSGVIRGYLNGKMKFAPIAISETIGGLTKLILGISFALYAQKQGLPLQMISAFSILGITVGTVISFLYLYISYARESKNIKREFLNIKSVLSQIIKIGFPIVIASALSSIVNIIDLSIIMNRLVYSGYSEAVGTSIYGNYTTLAVPLFSFAITIINTATLASLPIIAASYSSNNLTEMEDAASAMLKISLFISIPAFVASLFFPFEILNLIFEESSAVVGAIFLSALAPGILFYSVLAYSNTVLEGVGKVNHAMTSLIIGAVIKCIISYLLIGNERFGALGAPIGTSVSYLVSALISLHILNKNMKFKKSISNAITAALSVTSLPLLAAILIKYCIKNELTKRAESLIILGIFGFFYLLISLLFIQKRERISATSSKLTN